MMFIQPSTEVLTFRNFLIAIGVIVEAEYLNTLIASFIDRISKVSQRPTTGIQKDFIKALYALLESSQERLAVLN